MTNEEIPTIDPTKYSEESELFERIRNISMRGKMDRGYPTKVAKNELVEYSNKNGKIVYQGPDRNLPEEFTNKYGILSKKVTGLIYHVSTTNPNQNMVDPVTGTPTCFMYQIYADGEESFFFDAIPMGRAPSYNCPLDSVFAKVDKIKSQNLADIIKEINPNSKII